MEQTAAQMVNFMQCNHMMFVWVFVTASLYCYRLFLPFLDHAPKSLTSLRGPLLHAAQKLRKLEESKL